MDVKALLAKAISLLYRESQLDEDNYSQSMINDIINGLKINGADLSGTDNTLNELKNVIINMMDRSVPLPIHDLLQHVKIACGQDNVLFEAIQDNIAYDLPKEDIKKTVLSYRYELEKYLKNKKAQETLEKITFDLKFNKDKIDNVEQYLSSNLQRLTDMVSHQSNDMPGLICEVDISDEEAVRELLENKVKQADGSKLVKMPWQGLNRMTQGGYRLGDFVLVAGLMGNGKSLTSRHMFISACIFNNPKNLQTNHDKKPLNVLFTFEDSADLVVADYYSILQANLENKKVTKEDFMKLSPTDAAKYIKDKLESTGYTLKIINSDPNNVSYLDVINKLMDYESQGYEIHTCLIDYVSLLSKKGLTNTRLDTDIQELFRRIKNFCMGRKIVFISPHQLSTEALELKRNGAKYLARDVAPLGYYQDCKGLGREPELEIAVDIVKDNGKTYMCFGRGKHRGVGDTPEQDKFFIIPFSDKGLLWDINGKDTSMSKFGHARTEEGDEVSYFGPE